MPYESGFASMNGDTSSDYRYWAFISYSSKDKQWGRWLHRAIETYGIPAELVERHQTPTGHPAPKRFQPLFRDRDELPASSDLGTEIEKALWASRYLIVVCSPHAAQSQWVNKEVESFQKLGRRDRILAIIVDGEPNAGDTRECFPPALRQLEPIAADVRPEGDGKTNAKLKLLAGMLGVSFDSLKQRDAHRRIRRLQLAVFASLLVALSLAALATYAFHQRDKAVKARRQAESVLEFLVYDMRDELQKVGRLELVAKIQKRVEEYHRQLGTEASQPVTLHNQEVALENAGNLASDKGDLAGAQASFRHALAIAEELARQDPSDANWRRDLIVSCFRLGEVQSAQGDLAGALASFRQALAIAEALARQDPGIAQWHRDLGDCYAGLGEVQRVQGDLAGALASFRQALAIAEELARQDPSNANCQHDLSVNYDNIGDVQREQGDLAGALASFRQALAIAEQLARQDPGNAAWQNDLSVSYERLGTSQSAQGDLAGALASFRQALAIAGQLARQDPSNAHWQRNLSVSYRRLGEVQSAQGDLAGALASFWQASAIAERLARQDPGNAAWQNDLSVNYDNIGDVQSAQGDLAGALASYQQSMAIAEQLARQDPSNAHWQRNLWVSYQKMALVTERTSTDEAREWWRKAFERLSAMKKRGLFISAEDENTLEQLGQKFEGGAATNR